VRAAIAARASEDNPPRESVQAQDWAGHIVADVLGFDLSKKGDKARVGALLRGWIETKVLAKETFPVGANRKPVPCLVEGPNNPAEVAP
jgi:hypothetical protein